MRLSALGEKVRGCGEALDRGMCLDSDTELLGWSLAFLLRCTDIDLGLHPCVLLQFISFFLFLANSLRIYTGLSSEGLCSLHTMLQAAVPLGTSKGAAQLDPPVDKA